MHLCAGQRRRSPSLEVGDDGGAHRRLDEDYGREESDDVLRRHTTSVVRELRGKEGGTYPDPEYTSPPELALKPVLSYQTKGRVTICAELPNIQEAQKGSR